MKKNSMVMRKIVCFFAENQKMIDLGLYSIAGKALDYFIMRNVHRV